MIKNIKEKIKEEKGVSLLLATLLLAYIFAIAMILSGIVIVELQLSGNSVNSTVAIYAADSGIERALYQVRQTTYSQTYTSISFNMPAGNMTTINSSMPAYSVSGTVSTTSGQTSINSLGSFEKTQRGLNISF